MKRYRPTQAFKDETNKGFESKVRKTLRYNGYPDMKKLINLLPIEYRKYLHGQASVIGEDMMYLLRMLSIVPEKNRTILVRDYFRVYNMAFGIHNQGPGYENRITKRANVELRRVVQRLREEKKLTIFMYPIDRLTFALSLLTFPDLYESLNVTGVSMAVVWYGHHQEVLESADLSLHGRAVMEEEIKALKNGQLRYLLERSDTALDSLIDELEEINFGAEIFSQVTGSSAFQVSCHSA